MLQRILFLTVFSMIWVLEACSPAYTRYIHSYQGGPGSTTPDYSNLYYWAAHPWKRDASDSVPAPLRSSYRPDSSVDVFFLHPTTLTALSDTRWNADINDDTLNAKTDYTTILYQASAFNEYRVFAPRYRQAHLRAYYTTDTARAMAAFEMAYQDLKTAFQYYLDHYNNGRPIIIASHSQGSTHAQRLLKEFFENGPLKNRLVAAYVIGMYIPNNYFTSLPECRDSLQTGCVIGWRTFKEGYEPAFVEKEKGSGWVVNPLTWTTTDEYAPYTLNKGSVLTKFNTVTPHLVGAQIHDDVLWIDKLHTAGGSFVKMKNFHIGDINLFYCNIRDDVRRRVALYWKR
ncbi:MAG TPA: DUF3089 domain-containing protein [Chitinophagaceae bacterium]